MFDKISSAFGKLQGKLLDWVDALVLHLPNLLIALVIVTVGWYVAKYVYGLVHRLLLRASGSRNVADLVGSISRVLVVGVALFIALGILGLSTVVTSALTGAGIVGLAVGFALQDPLANLFSGIMMSVKELYSPGDMVETNGYTGNIIGITLRTTLLRTFTGQEVAIPNKEVLQSPLVNYSRTGERRVDLAFGVSYGDDLERAARIVEEAVASVSAEIGALESKEVQVFWNEFADSSINGTARVWLPAKGQADYLSARSRLLVAVKQAFDRADITIPFPIRTLDFGIVGGTRLDELDARALTRESQP